MKKLKRSEIMVGAIIGLILLVVLILIMSIKWSKPVDPNTPPDEKGVTFIDGKEIVFENSDNVDNKNNATSETDNMVVLNSEAVENNEPVLKPAECPFTDRTDELLKKAKYVFMQKVITETREFDGNSSCEQTTYFSSDFEIGSDNPVTINSLTNETVNFEDAFGFKYSGENAYDLYEMIKSTYSIDGDLTDVEFNAQDGNYVISCNQSTYNSLLTESYDEILEQSVSYGVDKISEIFVPNNFLITIKYKIGDEIVTKTMYLQIGI